MHSETQFDHRPKVKTSKPNRLPKNPEPSNPGKAVKSGRFPSWLHRKLPKGNTLKATGDILSSQRMNTVCEEAKCPNLLECWSKKTATFLTMGKSCTRSCGFCDIDFSKRPPPLDPLEPQRIADSVKQLGLNHVVLTMVARDDLEDGGANHLSAIIRAIRTEKPSVTIEVLTSDFAGNTKAWDTILQAQPEIFNYNIETVRELTPRVRHKATYDRTLELLHYVKTHKKSSQLFVKSGIMVGLGESEVQVKETLSDLTSAGCDIVTIGQYLQASKTKLLVKEFITPEQFKAYEDFGYSLGIKYVYSGPFVRSSYNAQEALQKLYHG